METRAGRWSQGHFGVRCRQQLEGSGYWLMWKPGELVTDSTKETYNRKPPFIHEKHEHTGPAGYESETVKSFYLLNYEISVTKNGASVMSLSSPS